MTDLGHGKDLKFPKTIDPSTPMEYSSAATISRPNQLTPKAYVDSTAKNLDQEQYIAGAKAGNDANSGTNRNSPVLTIAEVIAKAVAKSPSLANPILAELIDGGIYDVGSANITIPTGVVLNCNGATLKFSTGSIIQQDNSHLTIQNFERTSTGFCFIKTAGSGRAYLTILGYGKITQGGWIEQAAGIYEVDFKAVQAEVTANPTTVQVLGGDVNLRGNYLDNRNPASRTLRAESSGKIYSNVNIVSGAQHWLELDDTAYANVCINDTLGATRLIAGTATYDLKVQKNASESYEIHSNADIALSGNSVFSTAPYYFSKQDTLNNLALARDSYHTTSSPAAGVGIKDRYRARTLGDFFKELAEIDYSFTNVVDGLEDSKIDYFLTAASALVKAFTITGKSITSPVQPYFHAHRTGDVANVTGNGDAHTVIYNTVNKNIGGHYNNATGVYTALVDGRHSHCGSAKISGMTSAHTRFYIRLTASNENWFGVELNPYVVRQTVGSPDTVTASVSKEIWMDAGDTAKIDIAVAGSTKIITLEGGQDYTHYAGGLIW